MARWSSYPKIPIGLAFATSNRSNAKYKVKLIRNRTIDDLIECDFIIPGIKKGSVIKELVMGQALCDKLKEKYKGK